MGCVCPFTNRLPGEDQQDNIGSNLADNVCQITDSPDVVSVFALYQISRTVSWIFKRDDDYQNGDGEEIGENSIPSQPSSKPPLRS